jgi:hypothetical protein
MADTDAAREILHGLVFLANEAQRAGLPVVMRHIAAAVDDVAKWMDENGEDSDLPLGAPFGTGPSRAGAFGDGSRNKFLS